MIHMGLELNKLTHKVDSLGANAEKRLADLTKRLPVVQATFTAASSEQDKIRQKAEAVIAKQIRWAGAIPTDEPIDAAFPLPAHPSRVNIIAADGSQIYPDRHALALYYVINIGSIVFRHGLPEAPSVFTSPEVFFEDEDIYFEENTLTTEMINAKRDLRELGELARLAGIESAAAPTVTFVDNSLLLYIVLREANQSFSDGIIKEYLEHLTTIQKSGAAVAGVVDRPGSANIIRLLHLSTLEMNEIVPDNLRHVSAPFLHFHDETLFEFLKPGERSALFVLASPANKTYYEPFGHRIYFFFLNAGGRGAGNILRVEIPEWVAKDKTKLDLVHASIVEQSKMTGYPYVFIRADEIAVVSSNERGQFEQMVLGSLIKRGFAPSVSQKQFGKELTRTGKRWR